MKDIALDLGVSLMTVSKALRNHQDVAEETRRRVIQRAQELKYQPNLVARGLAIRRTFLIGLIVPDMMHSFFAEVARGVEEEVEPQGYQIVISSSGEDADRELQQIRLLMGRGVDGLIIASAAGVDQAPLVEELEGRSARYVLIDRTIAGLNASYVGVEDEGLGYQATIHLIDQGCRRIAHLRGPDLSTGTGRLRGYRRALAEHGIEVPAEYVLRGRDSDGIAGYREMKSLLRADPRPEAVFCYNDPVAIGAIKAILEAGLRIPADVAVIGAGNLHYSDLLRVPLSTIDQSSILMGQSAARLLLESLESKAPLPPRRILLSPRLIVRASSAKRTTFTATSSSTC